VANAAGALALAALWTALACSPPEPPHVVLVTFDTTRYDYMGFNGDAGARTPNADALAARGLTFDHAYASAPVTLPSHTTILTGLEPLSHGVHNNGTFRVPNEAETLAEMLGAAGYDTAAVVSAMVLEARYNLDQGFDFYSDQVEEAESAGRLDFSVTQREGDWVTEEALEWLAEREGTERPFFLWAHYYDPHEPRNVRPHLTEMLDGYAAEIAFADEQLGRLLEGVREAAGDREVLLVFTADHGESLGEHGEATHAFLAYDAVLHVPLVLAGPGIPQGVRSDAYARHVDLVPTILRTVGLPVPPQLPGRDLVAAAGGGPEDDPEVVGYFEARLPNDSHGWAVIEGVRTGRWKFTAVPDPQELYDILNDPDEQQNLAAEKPDVIDRMEALREELYARQDTLQLPNRKREVDAEERERLAALGYIDSGGSYAPDEAPDPRRFARAVGMISGARSLAIRGDFDGAIEMLTALAGSRALRGMALNALGPIYREAGRMEDAIATYEDYLELTGDKAALLTLGELYLEKGEPARTLELLDDPSFAPNRALVIRARALAELDRIAEAREELDRAFPRIDAARREARASLTVAYGPLPDGEADLRALLDEAPGDPPLLQARLGMYLAAYGGPERREEAGRILDAAAEAAPEDVKVLSAAARGYDAIGRSEDAVATFERLLALDASRHEDRARLAFVLRRTGEPQRARALLEESLARAMTGEPWTPAARRALAQLRRELAERPPSDRDA
jgi:arylsulfatase A-like enzyme/Flp pilus assembly protein TadD